MISKILACTTFLLILSNLAVAELNQPIKDEGYFTVDSIEVNEVDTEIFWKGVEDGKPIFGVDIGGGYVPYLDEATIILDKLVVFGEKIWTLVKKGKPVVGRDFADYISVLPLLDQDADSFSMYHMENWKFPKAKTYQITAKNIYGMTVVDFEYTVMFQYNGSYEGHGKYITGLNVVPNKVSVAWGYTFNAGSALVNISNLGTTEEPVAGALIEVSCSIKTILKNTSLAESFMVSGDGRIQKYPN